MTPLLQFLNHLAPLTDDDCEKMMSITKTIELKKGDFWIKFGKPNPMVAFVDEGYLRKYYIKDGMEITDYFYFDNDISTDLPSILGNTLPVADIVAMKKTTLTVFSYHDFNKLCKAVPVFEHIYR